MIGLQTPKYKAKVSTNENNNSGDKDKLDINSDGSKLNNRIAIPATFFDDNFKVILYTNIKMSINKMI